jgi:hypothetical protein
MTDPGFSSPIEEIIKERTSIRTYSKELLSPELESRLAKLLEGPKQSPFNGACEFHVVDMPGLARDEAKKLGTYGFISGAQKFIIVTGKHGSPNLREHVGYVLEKIILHLTDLGIGTCWIAGTFNRENYAEKIGLQEGYTIPIITPVGLPAKNRRVIERGMRALIRAGKKQRYPWSKLFFDGDFTTPLDETGAGPLASALEMVRLGPSASNKQPWRVLKEKDGNTCHFYTEPSSTGYQNMARFDIGIATCHFDLTVKEAGIKGSWKVLDPQVAPPANYTYIISWHATTV